MYRYNVRQSDLVSKELKFKQTKQNEKSALEKRITSGRDDMKKQRQGELARYYYYYDMYTQTRVYVHIIAYTQYL